MKVLIINQHRSDALGGSELQCDLIAKGLVGMNHEIVYAAINHKEENIIESSSYKILSLDLSNKSNLHSLLCEEKPDIVLWSYNKFYLKNSVNTIHKYRIPIVFIINHINDIKLIPKRFELNTYLRKPGKIYHYVKKSYVSILNHSSFNKIDGVITVNSQFENKLDIENQVTIFNPVPTELDSFSWNKNYCVWVANIKEPKRPELFIELSRRMSEINPKIDFLMIGNIQSNKYEKLISDSENKINNFHYLGGISPEKVNSVLKGAVCLIHTCIPEGFGMNFIQAWHQGCPTISYEFDPDNLIREYNLGFISHKMDQMVKDVSLIISDTQLRAELANRAKNLANNLFDPTNSIIEVEDFLKKTMEMYEYK